MFYNNLHLFPSKFSRLHNFRPGLDLTGGACRSGAAAAGAIAVQAQLHLGGARRWRHGVLVMEKPGEVVSEPADIHIYIYIYIYIHTHTHTHIYIYIYIYTIAFKDRRWSLFESEDAGGSNTKK